MTRGAEFGQVWGVSMAAGEERLSLAAALHENQSLAELQHPQTDLGLHKLSVG